MTKDEAKKLLFKENCMHNDIGDFYLKLINEIFDDFDKQLLQRYKDGWRDRHTQADLESTTCEKCKYSSEDPESYASLICELGVEDGESMSGFSLVQEDFGCNKHEPKDVL